MRQQMDESNHEIVHMLTQQIGTILRPLIQDSTQSYQQLETQMTRIRDFLGVPRAPVRQNPTPPPQPETPVRQEEMMDDTVEQEYQEFEQILRVARRPPVVLVNKNQDPDHVVRQIRHEAAAGEQNLEVIVVRIIERNGISSGLQRPTYSSPFPDSVLQTELPRGWKVPKFTKFAGDTEESTVGHVARYQTEVGDIANNEGLK
ncbi:uncharacterized protein LOC127105285 [Lathyrus oleraceus]|uniref:uncharacterized protein LOC127105285 n=1 Tax=Pisum sativum TaxID=3888 RepID=UPI0021D1B5C6|nr:uncharacterized protein LOC127105285 [Pisum sativum]